MYSLTSRGTAKCTAFAYFADLRTSFSGDINVELSLYALLPWCVFLFPSVPEVVLFTDLHVKVVGMPSASMLPSFDSVRLDALEICTVHVVSDWRIQSDFTETSLYCCFFSSILAHCPLCVHNCISLQCFNIPTVREVPILCVRCERPGELLVLSKFK